jgi:hypothetical protein
MMDMIEITMKTQHPPRTHQKSLGNVWGKLDYVCKKIHYLLYEKNDKTSAKHFQSRLQGILDTLPKGDLAILRAEGLALLHELKGEKSTAIQCRKTELKLIERLHDSVHKSVDAGDYDAKMGASILRNWDAAELKVRQAILKALEEEEAQKHNGAVRRKVHIKKE